MDAERTLNDGGKASSFMSRERSASFSGTDSIREVARHAARNVAAAPSFAIDAEERDSRAVAASSGTDSECTVAGRAAPGDHAVSASPTPGAAGYTTRSAASGAPAAPAANVALEAIDELERRECDAVASTRSEVPPVAGQGRPRVGEANHSVGPVPRCNPLGEEVAMDSSAVSLHNTRTTSIPSPGINTRNYHDSRDSSRVADSPLDSHLRVNQSPTIAKPLLVTRLPNPTAVTRNHISPEPAAGATSPTVSPENTAYTLNPLTKPCNPLSAVTAAVGTVTADPVTPERSHLATRIVPSSPHSGGSPALTQSCGNGATTHPEPSADSPSSALKPPSSAVPSVSASDSACAPTPPTRNGLLLPGRASLDTLHSAPAPPLALANPRRITARRSASSGENVGQSLLNRRTAAAGSGRGLALRREIPGLNRPGRGLGEIKLDMGALQRTRGERDFAREAQEAQARRDKFAFFEKDCSRVLEHVYVGSDFVARSGEILKEAGITHVLNCVGFVCPEYFPEEITYKTLWLQDNTGEDLVCVLYDVFDYIETVRESKGRVFIHCCQGISRSTSLVIAYIMWLDRLPFGEAFKRVKALRAVANPNMGFACQLLQWQKRILPPSALHAPPDPPAAAAAPARNAAADTSVGAAKSVAAAAAAAAAPLPRLSTTAAAAAPVGEGASPRMSQQAAEQPASGVAVEAASGAAGSSQAATVGAEAAGAAPDLASGAAGSCHMYRMAPHSPYDALHVVPKITALSRHSFDPRGAFIVQIHAKVYCWRGRECHPVMAKQAFTAAAQIIKYEALGEVLPVVREVVPEVGTSCQQQQQEQQEQHQQQQEHQEVKQEALWEQQQQQQQQQPPSPQAAPIPVLQGREPPELLAALDAADAAAAAAEAAAGGAGAGAGGERSASGVTQAELEAQMQAVRKHGLTYLGQDANLLSCPKPETSLLRRRGSSGGSGENGGANNGEEYKEAHALPVNIALGNPGSREESGCDHIEGNGGMGGGRGGEASHANGAVSRIGDRAGSAAASAGSLDVESRSRSGFMGGSSDSGMRFVGGSGGSGMSLTEQSGVNRDGGGAESLRVEVGRGGGRLRESGNLSSSSSSASSSSITSTSTTTTATAAATAASTTNSTALNPSQNPAYDSDFEYFQKAVMGGTPRPVAGFVSPSSTILPHKGRGWVSEEVLWTSDLLHDPYTELLERQSSREWPIAWRPRHQHFPVLPKKSQSVGGVGGGGGVGRGEEARE